MSDAAIYELDDPLRDLSGSREVAIEKRRAWIVSRLEERGRREALRVIIGSNTLTCGGAEHQILRLMPRLLELGLSVEHFYHGGPHYLKARFESLGLKSHFIDLHEMGRRRFISEATGLFRAGRFDIAHAFVGTANLYTRWAAVRAGVPVILGGWRARRPEASPLLRMLYSNLNRWSSAWIVNASTNSEGLGALFGMKHLRTYVVPNAFEFDESRRESRAELPREIADWIGRRRSVVTVGRVQRSKNYDLFIDVAADIASRRDDICFVLIASTDHTPESRTLEERLRDRIEREGLSNNILYTGMIAGAADLLSDFSLFLFTSEAEGCPNAVVEAMAAGLPIVMTRSTDTRMLVSEGENGYTSDRSVEELSRRIESILDDDEASARFGERSRNLAMRNFDSVESAWLLARIYLTEWERISGRQ
jgi:glycosyltransferase involved in cell wall biosynthesis